MVGRKLSFQILDSARLQRLNRPRQVKQLGRKPVLDPRHLGHIPKGRHKPGDLMVAAKHPGKPGQITQGPGINAQGPGINAGTGRASRSDDHQDPKHLAFSQAPIDQCLGARQRIRRLWRPHRTTRTLRRAPILALALKGEPTLPRGRKPGLMALGRAHPRGQPGQPPL